MIIGVTGKIASGKSSIAQIISKKGYYLFDADKVYHDLLLYNNQLKNELITRFGNKILTNNEIDRKKLIKLIDDTNIDELNKITHKYVVKEIYKVISKHKDVVIEAPVPIEIGFIDICDMILVSTCSKNTQLKRLSERNKYSKEQINELISIQNKKIDYFVCASSIIDTDNLTIEMLNTVINLLF